MMQDDIEKALCDRFKENDYDLGIVWERVEPYAIDDACRLKAAALGLVDQGQKFGSKISLADNVWRMAVEFFVRCNREEDIKTKVNLARQVIYRTMMVDTNLGNLLVDTSPVADEVFVHRGEQYGEGVLVFDLRYRTRLDDIGEGIT